MPGESTLSGINDVWLGGRTNTAQDRETAWLIEAAYPAVPVMARAGHAFGLRTARWAAGDLGMRRFIRAGFVSTLPGRNTHDAVGAVAAGCRVVYVTRGDPAAMAMELLGSEAGVTVARAPVRYSEEVLAAEPVARMLAEGEPVCLVTGTLMHFASPDGAGPYLQAYAAALPSGSVLAASLIAPRDAAAAAELGKLIGMTVYPHTAGDAARWLDGLEVVRLTPHITAPGTALGLVARIP